MSNNCKGVNYMNNYIILFTINGKRYQETVSAQNEFSAREAIKMRYPGQNIVFFSVKRGWKVNKIYDRSNS